MEEKLKYIIRIAATDLDGNKPIGHSLKRIKGISHSMSNALCVVLKLDRNKKTGALKDDEVKKIETAIKNPEKTEIPSWLLNRQKDFDSGEDIHLTTSDLKLRKEFDVKRLRKIKSYRGFRHGAGLPTRGQRTKSNFRRGKSKGGKSLGVKRKKK
jgi:small subunit ribosomal protein S13